MNELVIDAKVENLDMILDHLAGYLEKLQCPAKIQVQLAIAVEEIFVNIAHYAYDSGKTGQVQINFETENASSISICFTDWGIPYNPLAKEDPDVTLSAEERKIGGLGIYMVKKSMDNVFYRYEEGKNILVIEKTY